MIEVLDMVEFTSVGPALCRPTIREEIFVTVTDCPLVSLAVSEIS